MLKRIRRRLGFSQEEMARYLEISRSHYAHVEDGRKKGPRSMEMFLTELDNRMALGRVVSKAPTRELRTQLETQRLHFLSIEEVRLENELILMRARLRKMETALSDTLDTMDRMLEPFPGEKEAGFQFVPFFYHIKKKFSDKLKMVGPVKIIGLRMEIAANETKLEWLKMEKGRVMPQLSTEEPVGVTPLSELLITLRKLSEKREKRRRK